MTRRQVFFVMMSVVTAGWVAWAVGTRDAAAVSAPPLPPVLSTSRASLDDVATAARERLAANPGDGVAGVRLAEILLRKARVETDAGHALEAERVLQAVLAEEPSDYAALKMLGAVYLAQHRFREALEMAGRAQRVRDDDPWTYGVLGDAYTELGEYARAFDAYDTMARLRPDAAAYARVAHAQELQGRLPEALRHMQMAADATSPHDAESLAWHYAQLGQLHFQMGDIDSASREYHRANHVFPGHPYARHGLARVAAARGDLARSLQLHRELLGGAPTPELAAAAGDLLAVMGDAAGAGALYARAEQLEREGWEEEEPQPAALARLLAERGLKPAEAVVLAERGARHRSDIHTLDALAIAYFRAGRIVEARAASVQARRLGTGDRRILYHGALIEEALGNHGEARLLVGRALDGHAAFDPLLGPAASALARRLASRHTATPSS